MWRRWLLALLGDSGWLTETRRFRAIGSMELAGGPQIRLAIPLREHFDAVVWIEETSAALPLGNQPAPLASVWRDVSAAPAWHGSGRRESLPDHEHLTSGDA